MSQWDTALHTRIAAAIKAQRKGSSAQQLADRTAELGYPISRAQIANYESRRKQGLDVAELLIIAAALDVPPLSLLYPDLPDGEVEAIPDWPMSSFDAYLWASGVSPSFLNPGAQSNLALLLDAVRERWEKLKELSRLHVRVATEPDEATRKGYVVLLDAAVQQLEQINARISAAKGVIGNA